MKYCSNCGNTLKDTHNVCAMCGTKAKHSVTPNVTINPEVIKNIKETSSSIIEDSSTMLSSVKDTSKEKLKETSAFISKLKVTAKEKLDDEKTQEHIKNAKDKAKNLYKNKFFIISLTIVVILTGTIMGVNSYTNAQNTPEKIVSKFEKYVNSKDISGILEILEAEDSRTVIDETSITSFLNLLDSNPSYLNTIKSTLLNPYDSKSSTIKADCFSLKYNESKRNNKIVVAPIFIDITVPIADCTIYINGKEMGKSQKDQLIKNYGPLFPGEYELKTIYSNASDKFEDTVMFNTFSYEHFSYQDTIEGLNNNYIIPMLVDTFSNTSISTNQKDATLYVNDVDTRKKIGSTLVYGPIAKDSKLQAVLKIGDVELRSNIVYYDNSSTVYLEFENDVLSSPALKTTKEITTEVNNLLTGYLNDFARAVNYDRFSYIEKYLQKGSNIYTTQKKNIPNIHASEIKEDFVNFELVSLDTNEDNTVISVSVTEVYDITSNGKKSEQSFSSNYTIVYDNVSKSYLLSDIVIN